MRRKTSLGTTKPLDTIPIRIKRTDMMRIDRIKAQMGIPKTKIIGFILQQNEILTAKIQQLEQQLKNEQQHN